VVKYALVSLIFFSSYPLNSGSVMGAISGDQDLVAISPLAHHNTMRGAPYYTVSVHPDRIATLVGSLLLQIDSACMGIREGKLGLYRNYMLPVEMCTTAEDQLPVASRGQ